MSTYSGHAAPTTGTHAARTTNLSGLTAASTYAVVADGTGRTEAARAARLARASASWADTGKWKLQADANATNATLAGRTLLTTSPAVVGVAHEVDALPVAQRGAPDAQALVVKANGAACAIRLVGALGSGCKRCFRKHGGKERADQSPTQYQGLPAGNALRDTLRQVVDTRL
jgi:hypothetical protein